MPVGYFSLILHAHLPFVRHPEYPEFLEEDWLYEAITEVYLPLLFIFQNLHEAGAQPRLAMNVSPPLCEMLADELHLLLEGARVTAQSVGTDGLPARLLHMGKAMIAAHTPRG